MGDKLERSGLVDDWGKNMQGFIPETLLTFPLAPRTDEFFFENVTSPAYIRGGYFASSQSEESTVDFQITDPTGDVISEKSDQAEGLFEFMAKKKGLYTFVLSNHKWMQQKTVTFTIGRAAETLHGGHLDDISSKTQEIELQLRDIQTE